MDFSDIYKVNSTDPHRMYMVKAEFNHVASRPAESIH